MTSASRLSPKVHLALQYLIRNVFRIENVVSVRLAKSIQGTALNIHDITGSAHSRIIQYLKSTKPQAGFDQDMAGFEELADAPTPGGTTREASEAEPPHDDRRLSTIYE
eukprot:7139647-Pyramimonas_sp.AAC.1